jgi:enamine deaminase RidA (YjgF/YER057c/UK114 family)
LDSIQIPAYTALVRAVGLMDPKSGLYLGWFQHRDATWDSKQDPAPVSYTVQVPGLPAGVYRVEYWDIENGQIAGEEQITAAPLSATGGKPAQTVLEFKSLPITRMFAVRAFRVSG